MPVALYAASITHCFGEGLTQGNADIFHGVMRIDVQVAIGLNVEIDHAMASNLIEHMLQKRESGIKLRITLSVEINTNGDLRFQSISETTAWRLLACFSAMKFFLGGMSDTLIG